MTELGEYLEALRINLKLSKRQAALQAGISDGRWRQVVNGSQKVGGGIEIPANPKADTVVAMARAVGADVNKALALAGFDGYEPSESTAPLEAVTDQELLAEVGRRMAARSEGGTRMAPELRRERDQSSNPTAPNQLLQPKTPSGEVAHEGAGPDVQPDQRGTGEKKDRTVRPAQ